VKREKFVVPSLKPRRSARALAVSVALHVIAAVVLSAILVQTRIVPWDGWRRTPLPQERITYVNVAPAPAPGAVGADSGAGPGAPAEVPPRPAPRPVAPAEVPQGVTPAQPVPVPGGVPGGRGGGGGAGGTGPGTGMVPSYSDSRLWAPPGAYIVGPKTQKQVVDSVIDVAVGAYLDSLQVAARTRGREPGDWTVGDGDTKWGVDPKWIHFGKVKVPTALLALLPINAQSNPSFDVRERAAIRWDIQYHAQRSITEDEFRQSVKRIRERMEKQRAAERRAATP
jgi:hypothetical protein